MACAADVSYNINGTMFVVPNTTPSEDELEVCRATKILERLHKDFTGKYSGGSAATSCTGNDCVGSNETRPSYYLRNQPKSNTDTTDVNRFYENRINSLADNSAYKGNNYYRKMISVIMKGENDITESTYNIAPSSITGLDNFNSSPDNFKGIYGLNRIIEILQQKISTLLSKVTPSNPSTLSSGDAIIRFGKRKEIKNTLEEVAYRENQIYREKFLNIILVVVGIFLVGSQLTQKYFSGGGGGGGGAGAGLGGLFGFGFGGSGGLFSRFGGLGLGSSGRSHFDIGNLFKNSSYTLKQR
jgi:hypothetical protein